MREIKFRAYDKYKKEMHIVSGMDWDIFSEELKIISIGCIDNSCLAYNRNHTSEECDITALDIMQYTGLKDKNEKEIYEGDIVAIQFQRACKREKAVIKYLDKYAGFVLTETQEEKENMNLGDYQMENVEVIGNIYNNPELLGGKDGRN